MAKVSILVPVYGVEKFIEKCAVSLFEQTFDDIEYIFVNDQSKDKSIEILQNVILRYSNRKNRIKIINHSVNKGLAGARNTGIENATGDYILHVDSDDYIELNTIELLYNKAISENADVVVCNFFLEWSHTQKKVIQSFNENRNIFIENILAGKIVTSVWNKLIKRSLYVDNNIHAIEGVNLGEDFVTIPKLIYYSQKISKVSDCLYHYIQMNANSYTKQISDKNIENLVSVYSELEIFFKNKPNSKEFLSSMCQSKLIKKIELLLQSNQQNFDKIINLFPETDDVQDINFLNNRDKVVFYLMKKKNKNALKIYIKLYKKLFLMVQKIKGR